MSGRRALLALIPIAILVAIPLLLARERPFESSSNRRFIVIVTPHNEQIRDEFAQAFSRWHEKRFGEPVDIRWDLPGGSSEISRILRKRHATAQERGQSTVDTDILFGGGSYEFDKLSRPTSRPDGGTGEPVLQVAAIAQGAIEQAFPIEVVSGRRLYHEEKRWFASAVSTFGLIYNTDVLDGLRAPVPTDWQSLADPRLRGWVALANPEQSGSVSTAFETILLRVGWLDGWRILRRAGANARSLAGVSSDIPKRVAMGSCAIGVCIDFYARTEASTLEAVSLEAAQRLGFVAPLGQSVIDPDPVAMITGAREPELALHFIEFCISRDGQALWQFRSGVEVDGIAGPREHVLLRLPARKDMYDEYRDSFRDPHATDPFADTSAPPQRPHYRGLIGSIFNASVIANQALQREAWEAITNHPAYPQPADGQPAPLVRSTDVKNPQLREWLRRFDDLPEVPGPNGAMYSLAREDDLAKIHAGWCEDGWKGLDLWGNGQSGEQALRRFLAGKMAENFEAILREAPQARGASGGE